MTNEDRQTVIQALEAGRDAAAEVATRYHEAMAGYRKSEHERLDADVARIDAALAIMRREREPLTDANRRAVACADVGRLGASGVCPRD